MALAFACVLSISIVAQTNALSWVNPIPTGVYLPEQFGVVHAQLAGMVSLANGSSAPVVALVYFKALPKRKTVRLRAVAYFLDGQKTTHDKVFKKYLLNHISIAEFMENVTALPQFWLHSSALSATSDHHSAELQIIKPEIVSKLHSPVDEEHLLYNFQEGEYTSRIPYTLTGELPMSVLEGPESSNLYKLCINNWPSCASIPLKQLLADSKHVREQQRSLLMPSFVTVIKPIYGFPTALAAELVFYHSMFHQQLGIKSTLVYDRGDHLEQLVHHPDLMLLVRKELVFFMKWSHTYSGMPIPATNRSWGLYDQRVVYTHAALAFWGLNTYLYYGDLDEYLSLPAGQTVQHMFGPNGCMHDMVYVQFDRLNYHCQPGGIASRTHEELPVVPLLSCNLTAIYRRWFTWPKCIAFADSVAAFAVHDGFLRPGFEGRAKMQGLGEDRSPDWSCGGVVHLHNLVSGDRELPQKIVDLHEELYDGSWMWAFASARDAPRQVVRPIGYDIA